MGVQFILIRFLHEMATIIWIGGMIFQAIALTPVLKKMSNEVQLKVRGGVVKNFGKTGIICLIIITVTGIILSIGKINSGFSITSSYGTILIVKHAITAVLIVLSMVNAFYKMPKVTKLSASGNIESAQKTKKQVMAISIINPVLGIIVTFLSVILAYLSR